MAFGTGAVIASGSNSGPSPDYAKLRGGVKKIMNGLHSNPRHAPKATESRGLHYTDRFKHTTFLTGVNHNDDSQCIDSINDFTFALPVKKYFDQSCWTSDMGGGYLAPEDMGHSAKVTRCMVAQDGTVMVGTNVFENNMCTGNIFKTDSFILRDDNGQNINNGNCSMVSGVYTNIQCSMHYPFKDMEGYLTK